MDYLFICGLYKSGTSWLSSVLCAHPEAIGIGETDIVACAFDGHSGQTLDFETRMGNFFGRSNWCLLPTDVVDSLENGTLHLPDTFNSKGPVSYSTILPADAIRFFRSLVNSRRYAKGIRNHIPHNIYAMPENIAIKTFEEIRDATTPHEAMDAFINGLAQQATKESVFVFKAADQIYRFEQLNKWQPGARKLVIVRDARDAIISAQHFERLISEKDYSWNKNKAVLDYEVRLKSWKDRAMRTLKHMTEGNLKVIRYEDLSTRFNETLRPVLDWLGLDSSDEVMNKMNRITSFERITGRKRGQGAKDLMRKAMVEEWKAALSDTEKQKAWNEIGDVLELFGYVKDGELQPFDPEIVSEFSNVNAKLWLSS